MATHSTGESAIKTVSMERSLYEQAEERAKRLGFRSFSAYVAKLIEEDVRDRPAIVLRETSKPMGPGPEPKAGNYKIRGKTGQSRGGQKSA